MYTELYHVRHLCACGANISHSQGDFNAHKFHGGFTDIPVESKYDRPLPLLCSEDKMPRVTTVLSLDTQAELENIARFVNQFEPLALRLTGTDEILYPIACREARAKVERKARRVEWSEELDEAQAHPQAGMEQAKVSA